MGLVTQLERRATPLPSHCAPFDQPNTLRGHNTRTRKAVQMTQDCGSMLIFGLLILRPLLSYKCRLTIWIST